MTEGDRNYYYRRAEIELERAQQATCTPAVVAHAEMAERYLALCGSRPPRPDPVRR